MIVVHVNVRTGSGRQFRGSLFPIDLSVDVDVDITVLLSVHTFFPIMLLVDTDIIACLKISLQIRVHIVLPMILILILILIMVLLIPIHPSLLLGPIRLDIDRDALFPQRVHRVRQRLVRIDLFRVIVLVVLFGVMREGVYGCIFFVFVFMYVGVDVVVMVIRRFVEML